MAQKKRASAERQRAQRARGGERSCIRSAFAEFVPSKIPQAIISGVFVEFAERRIIEHLLDEFVDSQAIVEHHHPDVNKFSRVFTNDAYSQKFLVSTAENEFEHTRGIAGDMAPRALRKQR